MLGDHIRAVQASKSQPGSSSRSKAEALQSAVIRQTNFAGPLTREMSHNLAPPNRSLKTFQGLTWHLHLVRLGTILNASMQTIQVQKNPPSCHSNLMSNLFTCGLQLAGATMRGMSSCFLVASSAFIPPFLTATWRCRLRRAYSLNDTKQLPEWTDSAQGLATPFGKAMREAHDRRSQSSAPHMMPQQEQDQPEEAQPGASSPRSPGRRSPSKSVSEYASPRSSTAQPAGPSSSWVGVLP